MDNSTNMVDCLVLLANSDKLLARMHEIDMEAIISLLKISDDFPDTQVRVEVLQNQLMTVQTNVDEIPAEEAPDGEMPALIEQE